MQKQVQMPSRSNVISLVLQDGENHNTVGTGSDEEGRSAINERRSGERRQGERRTNYLQLVGPARSPGHVPCLLWPDELIAALQEVIEALLKVEAEAEELWTQSGYSQAAQDTFKRTWAHTRNSEMQARLDLGAIIQVADRRHGDRRQEERRQGERRSAAEDSTA